MRAAIARQPAVAAPPHRSRRVGRAAAPRAAKSRSPAAPPPPAPAAGGALPAATVIQLDMEPQLEKELQENGGCCSGVQSRSRCHLPLPCTAAQQPFYPTHLPALFTRGPAAGFRSTRRTKLIATIGPACDSEEMLEQLAVGWLWALLCGGAAASLLKGTAAVARWQ